MRITYQSGYAASMADLQQAASELAKYQRQVSSGKRVNTPSDDPSAMAATVRENAELAAIDQYTSSANSVTSRLSVADTVLADVVSKLTSARSTILAGQGTIQTAEQREATARELEGIRDSIFDDINTTFRGTYLFSGGLGLQAPYTRTGSGPVSVYKGDANALSVDVDRNRAMQVSFDGSSLIQGSDAQDLFTTFDQVIAAVRAGDQTTMASGLTLVESAFDRAVRMQSGVGADLNALDDQRTRLGQMKLANQSRLSVDQDANMAESITAMQQANSTYQSALGAIATRSKLSLLDYLK